MRGMLFSQMEPPGGAEEQFHEWYDTDHIPARLVLPGFAGATRYQALDGQPRYLAIYDIDDMGVLDSPEYRQLKAAPSAMTVHMLATVNGFTRFTCAELADSGRPSRRGEFLAVVAFAVPPEDLDQFDDWYDTEHSGMLLKAEDWLRVRRYRVLSGEGGPWNRFAIHELASTEAMHSPERAAAREGPKRRALADRPWFAQSGRWLYRVLNRAGMVA